MFFFFLWGDTIIAQYHKGGLFFVYFNISHLKQSLRKRRNAGRQRMEKFYSTSNQRNIVAIYTFLKITFHVYLFLRDRLWAGKEQRKRGTQNPMQAPGSELSTQSPTGTRTHNSKIMTWAKVGHSTNWATQAPCIGGGNENWFKNISGADVATYVMCKDLLEGCTSHLSQILQPKFLVSRGFIKWCIKKWTLLYSIKCDVANKTWGYLWYTTNCRKQLRKQYYLTFISEKSCIYAFVYRKNKYSKIIAMVVYLMELSRNFIFTNLSIFYHKHILL